jgi:alpha-glucosidase
LAGACVVAWIVALGACGSNGGEGGGFPGASSGDGGGGEANAPGGDDGSVSSPGDGSTPGDAGGSDGGHAGTVHVDHVCSSTLHLVLDVLDDGVARFHYVANGQAQAERGWIYDLTKFPGPQSAVVHDSANGLQVQTPALSIAVSGATCSIAITSVASGETLWRESAPWTQGTDGSVSIARALAAGEAVYGLGEKTGAANRRGHAYTMWNSDPAWSDPSGQYQTTSDPIYQSHPFFLSLLSDGHATGAFLDNTRQTAFDVGDADPNGLAMRASAGDVDLFFFDGPSPAGVLEEYTRLVGRAPLPPLWTLGYHQSRWSYTPQQRVLDVASKFRQLGLPADGMWLDIDYMNGYRDFTWDPTNFADPKGMLSTLSASGFKVTTITDPGVKSDPGGSYAAYNDGVSANVFISAASGGLVQAPCWPGNAVFPDFTSPTVRTWWGGQLGAFMDAGVQGTWIDMNEPAVFQKQGFPLDAPVNGEGQATTFQEVKNLYAYLMARATREGQLAAYPNRRPFVLTRAGFSGIQKYAAVWTGDAQSTWDFLAMQPAMLQGLNVSGVPFVGSDVGGFTGGPSPELYGRWFEVGSFSPFFRSHSETGSANQEPWAFGAEVQDLAARVLAVRYALLPYWYESFVATSTTGAPLMRPLWFEYPADAEAQKHTDEWFVGPSILVAPVTAVNVMSRPVYLPAGVFHDFYTGAAYTGPTTVTLPSPLGRVPILVRGGSVIPEVDVQNYVGEKPDVPRHLDVYPGPAGTSTQATLHEDDGETMAYAQGQQSTTSVTLNVSAQEIDLSIGARTGPYAPTAPKSVDVRVHGVAAQPSAVKVDGAAVNATWDGGSRVVVVPIADFTKAQAIAIQVDTTLAPVRTVNLAYDVTLPASTPAGSTIYVASSAGAWQPNGQALAVNGTHATGTLAVPEGTLVKYKVTRGAWSNVEVSASCASIDNRQVVADYGTTGSTSVAITVPAWQDHCP